jgi:hypothetical protein
MTTSDYDPESQAERRRVLLNDACVREQSGTYLSHTHSELGGRFAVAEHQIITGVASPKPPPLPASSPWSGAQPQPGPEPPLSAYDNPALEPSAAPPVEATDDPANAPPSGSGSASSGGLVSERAGSSPFPTGQDEGQ